MKYSFFAYGHPNITAKHKTTFEFTKDSELTLAGDCIIGVKADFLLSDIKKFISKLKSKKIRIEISVEDDLSIKKDSVNNNSLKKFLKNNNISINKNLKKNNLLTKKKFYKNKKNLKFINNNKNVTKEIIHAQINPDFNSETEMVIRKSDFVDQRTFAVRADKSSEEFDRNMINSVKSLGKEIFISIIGLV